MSFAPTTGPLPARIRRLNASSCCDLFVCRAQRDELTLTVLLETILPDFLLISDGFLLCRTDLEFVRDL